jgi:hypothetical protein
MRIVGCLAVTLLLAACIATPPSPSPTTPCRAAFADAAAVGAAQDSVADLYPAVWACESVAEWTEAFDSVGGAGFTGLAVEVLRNICESGAPAIDAAALCDEFR